MSQLIVRAGEFTFEARFEDQLAPKTCAAFRNAMPFESQAVHVRWSGEAVWIPLGDLDFGVGYENHTSYPAPGQIILYPGGISETEILLAYGGVHFASKMGQLAGNHFITLTSGLERLAELGKTVLWKGAQKVRFEAARMADAEYPRDLRGYGRNPPDPHWPGRARIAVQFVVNFEEGGENNILHGDPRLRSLPVGCARRTAVAGTTPRQYRIDVRIWLARRLLAAMADFYRAKFAGHGIRCRDRAEAKSRNCRRDERGRLGHRQPQPEMGRAQGHAGGRGTGDIAEAIRIHTEVTGARPLGWYTGRSSINTVRLVMEAGGFLYSCNSYADDLPYWIKGAGRPHLVIPYSLDANDMRFVNAQGFASGEQFFSYLKDSFDVSMPKARRRQR